MFGYQDAERISLLNSADKKFARTRGRKWSHWNRATL